ncbi:MAG TPA: lytic murein transglycosylase [Gaiellaceae bacterium]|nr:lytic murein transglycosylase [Gaiellaceae bacterium]
MRRLLPLLGAVLALAFSSTAAADTFRVVHPHGNGGAGSVAFAPDSTVVPFTAAQNGPMSFVALRGIWQAAGAQYGIPWEVLAAINKVETDFGRNLGPSSAGAVGWMQFMPSTWARWGTDANGDGVADPNNPTDAIFSAARYLAACGGQFDISGAVYCYNHASWYVNDVLGLAALYGRDGGTGLYSVDQLQTRLNSASAQVSAAHSRLAAALVRARKLAHAQQRYLRAAARAKLLSDQLEANKHAVQIGARRDAVMARVAHLRKLLHSATAQLTSAQGQANAVPFPATAGLQFGRIDQGVDLTSGHPYVALAAGTVVYIDPNFWQGTPAVYVKLDTPIVVGGRSYDEMFYSETPALVHVGERVVPGEPVIGPGSAELGFASGHLPAAHAVYHEGDETLAGHDFYTYLTAGSPGGGATPSQFLLVNAPIQSFQSTSSSSGFTSDVVYFTH